jgi:hypothetical protein
MSLKAPPADLAAPNLEYLQPRALIHRVHGSRYPGDAFNPCKGDPSRFAPMYASSKSCVPSLYAADTLTAAVYETLFRDIAATTDIKVVAQADVRARTHSMIEIQERIALATLYAPGLKRWGLTVTDLVITPKSAYPTTTQWAQAIHHQFPEAQGLKWMSNQASDAAAYLIFGDRVSEGWGRVVGARDGATDKGFMADVREAGRLADITLI